MELAFIGIRNAAYYARPDPRFAPAGRLQPTAPLRSAQKCFRRIVRLWASGDLGGPNGIARREFNPGRASRAPGRGNIIVDVPCGRPEVNADFPGCISHVHFDRDQPGARAPAAPRFFAGRDLSGYPCNRARRRTWPDGAPGSCPPPTSSFDALGGPVHQAVMSAAGWCCTSPGDQESGRRTTSLTVQHPTGDSIPPWFGKAFA